jgi:hypothetical protein
MWYAERVKMRYDAVDRTFCDAINFEYGKEGGLWVIFPACLFLTFCLRLQKRENR